MEIKNVTMEFVKVDRDSFLRKILLPYVSSMEIEKILKENQVSNTLSIEIRKKISDELIQKHCLYAGGFSLSTSLTGTASTLLLLPLDCAQFAYHVMKLAQELYYLFGTRNMFSYKSEEALELLLYMLIGAGSTVGIVGTSFGAIAQKLYSITFSKLRMRTISHIPLIGGFVHGSLSAYALHCLAYEYIEKLEQMVAENATFNPTDVVKDREATMDVEYHEVEGKLHHFCNLEKLREYYQYVEEGYLSQEEFSKLKYDLQTYK